MPPQVTNSNAGGFDDFDPFASLSPAPKTTVTMTTTSTLSETDQKAFESEFDDLLGDFSSSNGPQHNGEVITTVTKTTDGDQVTTVTSKSYDAPQVRNFDLEMIIFRNYDNCIIDRYMMIYNIFFFKDF